MTVKSISSLLTKCSRAANYLQLTPKATSVYPQRCLLTPPSPQPEKTVQEVIQTLTRQVIGGPRTYDPDEYKAGREALLDILPSSQASLPPRRMLDSYDSAIIPLGSDPVLRDKYLTHDGGVRLGRLLEDMDIFAVALVFKHVLNPKQQNSQQSPFSIVTALVDKIDIKRKILAESDVKISGHVTWVGRSSAESTLELHQQVGGQWEKVTEAVFVLVARDPTNKGSAFINPLEVASEEELAIYNRGIENQNRRQTMKNISLFSHPPSEEEKNVIHDFFIQTVDHKAMSFKARILPENSVWMEDAKLKNLLICQPENRNRFNKIFGGFIMRQAFELAWANAYVYGKARPFCMYMDDIWFRAPVEIGSLLYFNSQVCYTQDEFMQVRVSAEILSPETGSMSVTNVFQYTFKMKEKTPPQVIPKTYHEAMMWLQGRRHFANCLSSNTQFSFLNHILRCLE